MYPGALARTMRALAALFALALAAGLSPACGAPRALEDISYDPRFGDSTVMDVYLPDEAGPRPGVLFIHGGGWRTGSRGEYRDAAKRLARSGYVTGNIEYRLVGEGGGYPATVQDCLCALAHFRAHAPEYNLDPRRVALFGYSAGGHLVSLLGVAARAPSHQPDCAAGPTDPPNAVIVGAGPSNLRGRDHRWVREFLGGTEAERPDIYAVASPITHVGPGKPPYLFVGGSADWFVSIDDAYAMRDALVASGNDARVHKVTGGGHILNATTDNADLTLGTSDLTPEAWVTVMDFLERTVGR